MGPCTSGQLHRTWHGTSRGSLREEGSVGPDSEDGGVWTYCDDGIELSEMQLSQPGVRLLHGVV